MLEPPLTCHRMQPLVSEFVDGEMDARLQTAFEEHLGFCDDCFEYIAQTRLAIELVRALPRPAPDGSLTAAARAVAGYERD